MRGARGERVLVDTAVVHALCNSHVRTAAGSPAAAATAYEKVKHKRYDAPAAATDARMRVTPLIWDSLGAAGDQAAKWTGAVARAVASRFWVAPGFATVTLRERLAATVLRGVARILSAASLGADPPESDDGDDSAADDQPTTRARRRATSFAAPPRDREAEAADDQNDSDAAESNDDEASEQNDSDAAESSSDDVSDDESHHSATHAEGSFLREVARSSLIPGLGA